MKIDIRKSIKENFKGALKDEIKASIVSSISENDDVTLPGIGVFFEALWINSSDEQKDFILDVLENSFK